MSEYFSRLKSVLDQARALEGPARAAFLDEACAGDAALRLEAESLLAHADDAVPVLSTGAAVRFAATGAFDAVPGAHAGAQAATIGPYRIRRVLGEGGMGTVYEAEQVVPIRRLVALKLIRRGLDTDAVIARFKTERQALALMDHPAIARVLDAGASEDGRPYFVMELVAGVPITEYCRGRQLELRAALRLFLAVCQGVRHAHQKGIVHRDLKPSNVLVLETDGVAVPKIIDFGIAKAIDTAVTDGRLEPATRIGMALGTPDYMSPEQAGVIAEGVDTRTDVYSLGVLLYEILTGRRPHTFSVYTPQGIGRVLRGPDPPAPSVVSPKQRRQLAGDLDNITAKALARQPAERYASVEQFADDVRRHMEGEPVLAREATVRYRTAKFVRRHTAAVAVVATLAVLVLGAAVTFAIQAGRLALERDRARAAEQLAREQAATAESVVGFLVDLFQTSDPSEARGNTITAREILDRGAQRIEAGLQASPPVQATLLDTMGRVYQSLGLYTVAQPLLERALERRREVLGPEHGAVGETLDHLAQLRRARGDVVGAEPLYREALAIKQRALGPDHSSIALTLNNLAYVLSNTDRLAEAEALSREALAMRLRLFGTEHRAVAESRHELSGILRLKGDLAGAEEQLRLTLVIDRRLLGNRHPGVATALGSLGLVLDSRGAFAEAEAAHRESLEIFKSIHGDEHPNIAHASLWLASSLSSQGKLAEAGTLLETALDQHQRLVGEESPWVVADLQALGRLKLSTREYAQAERIFLRGMALAARVYGPESAWGAGAARLLGTAVLKQGRIAEAERILRSAEALFIRTRGPEHPHYASFLSELASAVVARGGIDEGEKLFRQALDHRRRHLPPHDPAVAQSLARLGTLLLDRDDPAAAEPLLREAVDIYREALPLDDPERIDAERALARCERAR